jgi:hypothetical protein
MMVSLRKNYYIISYYSLLALHLLFKWLGHVTASKQSEKTQPNFMNRTSIDENNENEERK